MVKLVKYYTGMKSVFKGRIKCFFINVSTDIYILKKLTLLDQHERPKIPESFIHIKEY